MQGKHTSQSLCDTMKSFIRLKFIPLEKQKVQINNLIMNLKILKKSIENIRANINKIESKNYK